MTAMRVATTSDAPRGFAANNINSSKFPPVNPASSYQTATPQQLQAAGIQASVVSDRQMKPRAQKQPQYGEENFYNRPSPSTSGLGYSSSQQQQQSTLSPYHQQLLVGNKGVQNVQSVKELTKMRLQNEASLYAEAPGYGGSRADQLQQSNAALFGRGPATASTTRTNAPPLRGLFGGTYHQEESGDDDGDSYYQQQQQQFGHNVSRQQFGQQPVRLQPVGADRRHVPTARQQQLLQQQYNSEDESDYALNSMLASYDRDHQQQQTGAGRRDGGGMGFIPQGLLPQTTARDHDALYDFQQQQLGLSDDDGQDYSGNNEYFTQALQGHNLPTKQHFSDSFGELSQLDREMAIKLSSSMAPSTSALGGPRKLGTIMKSKSQPLIPLGAFSQSPSLSPLPGRSMHGFLLPELDSHSPTTSRENTPKQPLSKRSPLTTFASPSDSFLSQPTASPAGLLPTLKQTRSALRLGSVSPQTSATPLNGLFPRKQSTFSGSLGSIDSTDGIDDYLTNEMAESVLGGLNTPRDTPKLGQIGKGFSHTKDVNEFRAMNGGNSHGIASPNKRDLFSGFMADASATDQQGGRFEWTVSNDEQDDALYGAMDELRLNGDGENKVKRSNNDEDEEEDMCGPLSRHSSGLSTGAYSAANTPRHRE